MLLEYLKQAVISIVLIERICVERAFLANDAHPC